MKKSAIVFTMFLAFIVVSKSYGQDSIKANYRDFLTELNVNLFQGELSLSNALKEVKGRYMFEKDKALRGGLIIDSKRETGEELTMSKKKYTRTSTLIGFSVGIEKHFPGTKRLSPYIGCDLFVANKWTKEKDTFYGSTAATINGAWEETQIVSTTGMLSTTTTYHDRNPKSVAAVLAAAMTVATILDARSSPRLWPAVIAYLVMTGVVGGLATFRQIDASSRSRFRTPASFV